MQKKFEKIKKFYKKLLTNVKKCDIMCTERQRKTKKQHKEEMKMKKYKGYYIDGVFFNSKADIDEHIKAQTIESYKTACEMFSRHSDMEHSIYASEIADSLHDLGLSWDEIEQIEIEAYKAA